MSTLKPKPWMFLAVLLAVSMTWVFIIEFRVLKQPHLCVNQNEPNNIHTPPALSDDNVVAGVSPYTTLTDPIPPLILISRDCSGSSFITQFAWKLVMSHTGRDVYNKDTKHEIDTEFVRSEENNVRFNSTLAETNRSLADKEMVLKTYKDIVIDSEPPMIMAPKLRALWTQLSDGAAAGLRKLGARVVMTYRKNKLGRNICLIRDCFRDKSVGVTVYENGTIADLCFNRRRHPETRTLARINATAFDEEMRHLMKQWGCTKGLQEPELQDIVKDKMKLKPGEYPSIDEESLIAFELEKEGSPAFQESVESWKKFLRGWSVMPQEDLILDEMRKVGIGTRPRSSTKRKLENYNEIETVVRRWTVDATSSNGQTCDWSWMMN